MVDEDVVWKKRSGDATRFDSQYLNNQSHCDQRPVYIYEEQFLLPVQTSIRLHRVVEWVHQSFVIWVDKEDSTLPVSATSDFIRNYHSMFLHTY